MHRISGQWTSTRVRIRNYTLLYEIQVLETRVEQMFSLSNSCVWKLVLTIAATVETAQGYSKTRVK